jgi:hypothetical protein
LPLRIAFDLDGVLADMEGELVRHADLLFGDAMKRTPEEQAAAAPQTNLEQEEASADETPPSVKKSMTARQQRRLWRHVASIEDFWENLREIEPGAVERLGTVAVARRWEVIFLTKRPETAGATAQVQSQRWLESKGFPRPSVYVVQGSRGRIAAALALDIVVDDRAENCLDVVVDSSARAILVWRDDQDLVPAAARRLGIGVVKSVNECLDILTEVDASDRQQPGIVGRVMRALGLKEPIGQA